MALLKSWNTAGVKIIERFSSVILLYSTFS